MIAVAFRYLMDMMALRSGEKLSEDIEWVTPEGELNGRLSEEEGRLLRERWRESIVYVDGPRRPETPGAPGAPEVPETDLDVGDDTPTTSTSGADIGRVRLSSRRIEKLFGRFGRP